jgi:hypothetical protein
MGELFAALFFRNRQSFHEVALKSLKGGSQERIDGRRSSEVFKPPHPSVRRTTEYGVWTGLCRAGWGCEWFAAILACQNCPLRLVTHSNGTACRGKALPAVTRRVLTILLAEEY